MIAAARELDLLTTPYVFNEDEPCAMTEAGADIIVCHMGLTTGGTIGAETAQDARRLRRADRRVGRRGPRASATTSSCSATAARSRCPTTPTYVLQRADGIHGFYGASSMERLPVEQALKQQTEAFKAVTFA